ncbi:MAG: flagellar biosynthetic protein FliQ [Candidatus Cloacimonadales bacterium]|jgi:flagellar biosynthetic protein FliQ|nr:flagellar type III secretion system protein FliQ [Candidatus Cloacimonadota bacterium]MDD2649516.1 flagellar biosynthetic protein FliQ [Candidatus Cloacimonadota bacterium]MDX9977560.1 flagellar biosynthetic protein FliQ [Candidatus Cloacimonadales bacterium]
MSQELVVEIATKTLYYTMIIAAPVLITGLVIGVLLSIMQSVIQIKEMTLTFIPKILSITVVLLLTIPWMINKFIEYFNYIMNIMMTVK